MSQPTGPRRGSFLPKALVLLGAVVIAASRLVPGVEPSMGLVLALAGVGLSVAGLVTWVIQLATRGSLAAGPSFEWTLAWRYLRVQHKRSWGTFIAGLALLLVAAGLMVASYVWGQPTLPDLGGGPTHVQRILRFAALGAGGLAHWVLFFGVLMLFFSLFTTISIFTVFLGLEALVAVLSMMGGFEHDLQQKILGTTAHVVVTRPKGTFEDYRQVLKQVEGEDYVVAASPYLESEVMITSQTNLSGVLVRGVDPTRIDKVTNLRRFLKAEGGAGQLESLLHPERLARIPEARFKPMVTVPLGKGFPGGKDGGAGGRTDGGAAAARPDAGNPASSPSSAPAAPASAPASGPTDATLATVPTRPIYPAVILGAELAKNLRLYIGDDVNMVAPLGGMSPAGPIPKSKPFRVAGIFYSGLYEYDNKLAFVTIPAAQKFLGLDDEITGIEVKVRSLADAASVAESLERDLGSKGYQVQDWRQRNSNLFSALKLEKLVMFIVLTFIVLVASFSIVTNLNMVVLEKLREIAVLKAMGAQDGSVLKAFLYAGLYIGLIGMLVGVLSGVGICLLLGNVGLPLDPEIYYISELPVRMDPVEIGLVALAGVVLSLLATIYPSLLAARLRPVDGLRRHEV